jgi:hypothetical protein
MTVINKPQNTASSVKVYVPFIVDTNPLCTEITNKIGTTLRGV